MASIPCSRMDISSTAPNISTITFKFLNVIIQGETEEEMQSWIDAITSVSPRGRSSSEPVCLHTFYY